jgi:glutamyl-tRNA synthetase
MAASARYCYEDFASIEPKAARKHLRPVILEPLRAARARLEALGDWTREEIATAIAEVAAAFDLNLGKLGQPIRVAVTGAGVSPPIDVTVQLVGRDRALKRLGDAIEIIESRSAHLAS